MSTSSVKTCASTSPFLLQGTVSAGTTPRGDPDIVANGETVETSYLYSGRTSCPQQRGRLRQEHRSYNKDSYSYGSRQLLPLQRPQHNLQQDNFSYNKHCSQQDRLSYSKDSYNTRSFNAETSDSNSDYSSYNAASKRHLQGHFPPYQEHRVGFACHSLKGAYLRGGV